MSNRRKITTRLLGTTMLSGLAASVAVPATAVAQQASDDVIQVTGTRIVRTDTIAPSPVTSVNEELFEINNIVNAEDLLNTLPQLIPAFDSSSNNPGNGTATLSLRGLGTTRTLVLVDGARMVGSGAANVVDVNNIPAAMIERVDVVTGGASAIYGSDAIAGVVNFILRDDFEGLEVNASHEFSIEQGDGAITDVSAVMGGNFDDGRGNATISFGWTSRESVFQGDRDFSRETFWDNGPGATTFFLGGSTNIPNTRYRGRTSTSFGGAPGAGIFGFQGGPNRAVSAFNLADIYNYAPTNYLQLPQERYNISGFANYEVNNWMEVYARGIFANNVVDSQLAPTPTGSLTMTVNLDSPLLPPALLTLIQNDPGSFEFAGPGTGTIRVNRRMEEIGFRNSLRDTNTFQALFGARGNISDNWSYDTFYSYARSAVSQIQSGNISVAAFQQALLCDGGPTSQATAACAGVPALDIFNGPGGVSAAAATYVSRTGAQNDEIIQSQFYAAVSGNFSSGITPMTDVAPSVVVGVEYRESSARILPDSVLGPDVRGFNQSLPIQGDYDVYEGFAEVDLPLVTGRPGFESLNLTGALRVSDYSTVGQTVTYAGGIGYEPIPGVRFRTIYNRAVRAPNVGDLFAPATNGFPGAQDPCSSGPNGSFSANTIVGNCTATGVPAAQVGQPFQSNGQIEALFGGNPNVQEEVADTFTFGVVLEPEQVPGLVVQVDYYDIEVTDAIATPSLQNLLDECYFNNVQASCAFFVGARDPGTGEMTNPFMPSLVVSNLALLRAEGVDIRVDYNFDAEQVGLGPEWGSFALNYFGGIVMDNGYQTSQIAGYVTCEGEYGLECGEPTPDYKHTAQASWMLGPWTTNLRWRHLPSMVADSASPPLSDLSSSIDAYNYFDVTFSYDLNDNAVFRLGVSNLMDEDPPAMGTTVTEQANTWPATYDTLGRRLFIGTTLRF